MRSNMMDNYIAIGTSNQGNGSMKGERGQWTIIIY